MDWLSMVSAFINNLGISIFKGGQHIKDKKGLEKKTTGQYRSLMNTDGKNSQQNTNKMNSAAH